MFTASLSQLNEDLAVIQAARWDGSLGRMAAIERFHEFASRLGLTIASDAAAWQESILHRHPQLERAVPWNDIDSAVLGDALVGGNLTNAVEVLRAWAPSFARSVIVAPLSEVEMAVMAAATEHVRDLADTLECGSSDDGDPGPARISMPRALRNLADGMEISIHPAVYADILAQYCLSMGWTALPAPNELREDTQLERVVAEGVVPVATVFHWLERRERLTPLREATNHRLTVLREALRQDLGYLTEDP